MFFFRQTLNIFYSQVVNKKKGRGSNVDGGGKGSNKATQHYPSPGERPGTESYRKTREDLTTMDKLHMALTELSYSINFVGTINVWEYTFAPREYLNQHLETR